MLAAGIPTGTAQNAPIFVGIALSVFAVFALWYRDQLYLANRWFFQYSRHGVAFVLVQLVLPLVVLGLAVVLVVYGALNH